MQRKGGEAETCRVVLIGDTDVGKTCLVRRLVRQEFSDTDETIGAAYETFEVALREGKMTMQIWDTAGQEKYMSLGPVYYRGASAGIFVYDITEPRSLEDLPAWVQKFRDTVGVSVPIFIVGTKADLDDRRRVDCRDGQAFCEKVDGKLFLEASALTGSNVLHLFQRVADVIVEHRKAAAEAKTKKTTTRNVDLNKTSEEKNSCC